MQVIESLLDCIAEMSPLQENNVKRYLNAMSSLEKDNLDRRLNYLLSTGNTIEDIAQSYLNFCMYFLEERKYFVEHGQYRYSTYEEASVLYEDREYMNNYMVGLALGLYMWQIQRVTMDFFRKKCSEDKHEGGAYLEVGPGHGEYLVTAFENMNFDSFYAVDISQSSVDITNSFLNYVYHDQPDNLNKILVERKDFFDLDDNKYDAIVISEVIEHVVNPKDFLVQVKKLAKKDSFIYISTAINSPFPDHLYLFRSIEEVHKMIEEAGLIIVDEITSTSEGISLEKAIKKKYDITIGFILSVK